VPTPARKPLMRSLGEFWGHIWHGATKRLPPNEPDRRVVREQVQEHEGQAPDGTPVTLRRTTIDEIEIRKPD